MRRFAVTKLGKQSKTTLSTLCPIFQPSNGFPKICQLVSCGSQKALDSLQLSPELVNLSSNLTNSVKEGELLGINTTCKGA